MDLLIVLAPSLVSAVDPVPEPEDVRAGWTALWIFLALCVAVALLMWNFTRQIRKTRSNAERGVFGEHEGRTQERSTDRPAGDREDDPVDGPVDGSVDDPADLDRPRP